MTTVSVDSSQTTPTPNKGLSIALWVVQALVGAAFVMAGLMKSTAPVEELAEQMPWVASAGAALVRFIGVSELAGGIGLILPALTRIKPVLTAWAGVGLAVVMVLAAGYHVVQSEWEALPVNFVLGGLAAFVAWGRFKAAPIQSR